MFGRQGQRGPSPDKSPAEGDVLACLDDGEQALIKAVSGGGNLRARLENMGLREGKLVTKLGAMPGSGPITVECDGFRVALGRGIAQRVQIVRMTPPEPPASDAGKKAE